MQKISITISQYIVGTKGTDVALWNDQSVLRQIFSLTTFCFPIGILLTLIVVTPAYPDHFHYICEFIVFLSPFGFITQNRRLEHWDINLSSSLPFLACYYHP